MQTSSRHRRALLVISARQAPSGLSRERALAILGQLVRALRELRRLRHQANNRGLA